MITNLHIKNIGIIDDLEINLNKGMNVLTGETGAGKTTIAKAILADFHRLWKNHIGRSILVALSSNALTPSLNN